MAARQAGLKGLMVPRANAREAAVVPDVAIRPVDNLRQVVNFLLGLEDIAPLEASTAPLEASEPSDFGPDLSEVKGQMRAKRALTVAAAGGHNIIFIGPPGSGKTMLAQRLPSILPPLSFQEAVETTKIYSALGQGPLDRPLILTRPFRNPHHTISDVGLIGGGRYPQPGEVSLAHNGVLFLDELPEFKKAVLEVLRQPLEDGRVAISRAAQRLSFPARFMLVAAMNPCPCGYLGDSRHHCACQKQQIQKYRAHISGPLMDRLDIHLETPAVSYSDLAEPSPGPDSAAVRAQVSAARRIQAQRFAGQGIFVNAQMNNRQAAHWAPLDSVCRQLMEQAMDRLGLSARAFARIIKIARTIADLQAADNIAPTHLAEAISYRSLDRQ